MGWLSGSELAALGFKSIGKNVKISSRAIIYNTDQIEIGDHSRVDDLCILSGKVTIGRNVHIAVMCNVSGGEPGIVLNDFSGLAYNCQIFAQSDDYTGRTLTNPTVPDQFKKERKAAVVLGRHVIVGTSSVIMPGVHVAEGGAIGALSLVHKSTLPWSVYAGNPAVRVMRRYDRLLALEAQYLESSVEK